MIETVKTINLIGNSMAVEFPDGEIKYISMDEVVNLVRSQGKDELDDTNGQLNASVIVQGYERISIGRAERVELVHGCTIVTPDKAIHYVDADGALTHDEGERRGTRRRGRMNYHHVGYGTRPVVKDNIKDIRTHTAALVVIKVIDELGLSRYTNMSVDDIVDIFDDSPSILANLNLFIDSSLSISGREFNCLLTTAPVDEQQDSTVMITRGANSEINIKRIYTEQISVD